MTVNQESANDFQIDKLKARTVQSNQENQLIDDEIDPELYMTEASLTTAEEKNKIAFQQNKRKKQARSKQTGSKTKAKRKPGASNQEAKTK